MNAPLPLAVIIPVHNGAATLARCLASVFSSDPVQVIVVDDASTDRTPEIAAQFLCKYVRLPAQAGAAAARNRGASQAAADLLFFLDADILVEPNTLGRIARTFEARPEISALFGSYQKETVPTNFVSVYKNLSHHYIHQTSSSTATTFCGGFGAVRRKVFFDLGGFSETQRALEDIELGYRMHVAGYQVVLDKTLQFTHCKKYTLAGLIRSDVFGRAVPWTRLMLKWRIFQNDLNTKPGYMLSVVLAYVLVVTLMLAPMNWRILALFPAEAAMLVALNWPFLAFVFRERGVVFALQASLMNLLYYLYSGFGLVLGVILFLIDESQSGARRHASRT